MNYPEELASNIMKKIVDLKIYGTEEFTIEQGCLLKDMNVILSTLKSEILKELWVCWRVKRKILARGYVY